MSRFWHIVVLYAGMACAANGAPTPWAELTSADLNAIHDTLRDNHPAPVDPEPAAAPYKRWLEEGLVQAKARAKSVTSFEEYLRVTQFYTNGFRDGHISLSANVETTMETWTGFVLGGTSVDDAVVMTATEDAGIKPGDRLLSCDGKDVAALLHDRTDPYYWNADIPHARFAQLYRLFYQSLYDPRPKLEHCQFASGPINLSWRAIRMTELQPLLQTARGRRGSRELKIQKIGDVWLISIPTFNYPTDEDLRNATAFTSALRARAHDFEQATIILDVRGNGGGDSNWGEQFAAALWGKSWVDRIESRFDDTVDWRASTSNIKALEDVVARKEEQGSTEGLVYAKAILMGMREALSHDQVFYRETKQVAQMTNLVPANPLRGRVYLFTDSGCGSACLDFADLITRLPSVTQIGLPTYADALYIDNNTISLPSGLTSLNYGMKVYRHRVRGNNVWYNPKILWPGGPITDELIANWVATLVKPK